MSHPLSFSSKASSSRSWFSLKDVTWCFLSPFFCPIWLTYSLRAWSCFLLYSLVEQRFSFLITFDCWRSCLLHWWIRSWIIFGGVHDSPDVLRNFCLRFRIQLSMLPKKEGGIRKSNHSTDKMRTSVLIWANISTSNLRRHSFSFFSSIPFFNRWPLTRQCWRNQQKFLFSTDEVNMRGMSLIHLE